VKGREDEGEALTLSRILPYLTVLVPEARVEAMPPSEASAPGSTVNMSPVSRMYSLSCLRVTPATYASFRLRQKGSRGAARKGCVKVGGCQGGAGFRPERV
jgi:hypothetical protein